MKVVELASLSRSAGGVFYASSALCKAMLRRGTDLEVLGGDDAYASEDRPMWGAVPTIACKTYGPLHTSFRLRSLLSRIHPDLVHLHGLWLDNQWASLQWRKKTGRPVVISPHGMLDPWAVRNSAWKKKLAGALFANQSLESASCIHALCRSEAESIRAYGLSNPIAIIPNGVDLPVPTGFPLSLNRERKRLLYLGRIHPKKGLDELVSGWAMLRSGMASIVADWQLVVAGWDDGGHLEGLLKRSSDLGLAWTDAADPRAEVCFLGPVFGKEKDLLLRSADAFILPSFSEGLPISVLEAWSYSLPVAMTDACNLPEGFGADAAFRIEPEPESLAGRLHQFLAMDDLSLRQMGANGRNLVEHRFTWDQIASNMLAVYGWCMGGDKPACIIEA